MWWQAACGVFLLVVASCGGESMAVVDSGGDATGDAAIVEPAAPAPPLLTPCPASWREAAEGELPHCEPYDDDTAQECAAVDEAHFVGEPGCVRVGTACPVDGVPQGLPADATIVYVMQGPVGGDGTRASPFGTIGEASSAAGAGTTIAVGRGRYDEVVRTRAAVTLVGACVAETLLTSSSAGIGMTDAVFNAVRGGTFTLRNLRIGDSERTAIYANAVLGGELVVDDAVVQGAKAFGVLVSGTQTDLRSVVIRDIQPTDSGSFGRGMVSDTNRVGLSRVVMERTHEAALTGMGITQMSLTDVALRSTRVRVAGGVGGRPAQITSTGPVTFSRVVLEDGFGVGAQLSGGPHDLSDVVIRRMGSSDALAEEGRGLDVIQNASVAARRMLIEDVEGAAVLASDDASVTLADVVLRHAIGRQTDGTRGRGLDVQNDSTADLERCFLHDLRESGVVINATSTGRLRDVAVVEVREQACAATTCQDEALGIGLGAFRSGALEVERFIVDRAQLCGVQVALDGAIDLSEGVVSGAEIGACIQVDDYDVDRVRNDVFYRDNDINLQATDLPVPDVS